MIIRRKHNSNFTIIPNRIFDDPGMTVTAGYILMYLLSRPDDWKVHYRQIASKVGVSERTVHRELKLLCDLGYVTRELSRDPKSKKFKGVCYTVFDDPESQKSVEGENECEPFAKNDTTVISQETSRSPKAVMRNLATLLSTERDQFLTEGETIVSFDADASPLEVSSDNLQTPYLPQGPSPSAKTRTPPAADKPLTTSAMIWGEGRALFDSAGPKRVSLIGRWIKQAGTDHGRLKLLALIRAAKAAGTGDPASYVTKALNAEYPPRAKPAALDLATWQRNASAALKTKSWTEAWGPAPGKPGCKMPAHLITPQLTTALSQRRISTI